MGKILNGFTDKTAQNLQLDAGILAKNLTDPKSFAGTLTAEQIVGATSGGGSFTAKPELRNIFADLDGARGSYKDGNVVDNWEIKLTATLKEMTAENFKLALGASRVTKGQVSDKYDTIEGKMVVEASDYLNNLCWIGTLNGQAQPIIIELKNVLNISGVNFSFADKGTGGLAIELQAHFSVTEADRDKVPFTIYTPKTTV
ncbi:MAG: hypothetical protein ACRDDY_02540 [Clostridium sp.]|uniref:hypothetical protein n=1 Tax=Clostridium TaxID=1485 RepID=UPI003EE58236